MIGNGVSMFPSSTEIANWLQSALDGDQTAFGHLFTTFHDDLKRMVGLRLDARLRRRIDPSDIVQETQLEAYRRIVDQRAPVDGSIRLWLRGIALERIYNAHRDHLRTQRRNMDRELPLPEDSSLIAGLQLVSPGSSPSARMARQENASTINLAMERLKQDDRDILILRVFEGLTNQEAAEVLGIDVAAASKRFSRALVRIHQLVTSDNCHET